MKDSWTAALAYPVHFEGKSDAVQTEWETIYTAPTQADIEFRMNSYQFPVFPFMRIRDANGQIFEVTQDQLLGYNEKTTALTQQKVAPLKAFAGSAPEKALETAQELIRAGMAAKHFVIPLRSYVLIDHPNLHHLRLVEFEDSVVCRNPMKLSRL